MQNPEIAPAIATAIKHLSLWQLTIATIKNLVPRANEEDITEFLESHGISLSATANENWASVLRMLIERIGEANLYLCRLQDELPFHAVDSTIRHHLLLMNVNIRQTRNAAIKSAIMEIQKENVHKELTKTEITAILAERIKGNGKTQKKNKTLSPHLINRYLLEIEKKSK